MLSLRPLEEYVFHKVVDPLRFLYVGEYQTITGT